MEHLQRRHPSLERIRMASRRAEHKTIRCRRGEELAIGHLIRSFDVAKTPSIGRRRVKASAGALDAC